MFRIVLNMSLFAQNHKNSHFMNTQPAITCSKLTIETPEQAMKLVKVNYKDTRAISLVSF